MREAGAAQPILLLEGVFEADELPLCARLGFEIAVHEPGQLADAGAGPARAAAHRLAQGRQRHEPAGLPAGGGIGRAGAGCADCAAVAPGIRLMTHFASADEPSEPATRAQLDRLRQRRPEPRLASAPSATRPACSPGRKPMPNGSALASCSTASRRWPAAPAATRGCRPVMTLTTRLIAVKEVPAGRARRLWRHLAGRRGHADRHRRHRLWRRLPAPCPLRHAGPGRRPTGRRSPAGCPWTCWRSTSRADPEASVGDACAPLGRGPAGRDHRRARRHHRLRALLRHHRPRPCRAPGCRRSGPCAGGPGANESVTRGGCR